MRLFFLFYIPSNFVFSPLTLFTLRKVSPSSSASTHGKDEYLFQRQEQREAASGQKHPSIRSPSLPPLPFFLPPSLPPLPLHRDLCCLDASEWRSSCGWLRAKHATAAAVAALPQQLCFCLLQLCVQLCGPTASTVTCSKLILWLPHVHASVWNLCVSVGGFWMKFESLPALYNSVIDADPKKASSLLSLKM